MADSPLDRFVQAAKLEHARDLERAHAPDFDALLARADVEAQELPAALADFVDAARSQANRELADVHARPVPPRQVSRAESWLDRRCCQLIAAPAEALGSTTVSAGGARCV